MGDPELWEETKSSEGPPHQVKVERFALSRYEVTVGQFATFAAERAYLQRGCQFWNGSYPWPDNPSLSWRDPGFQQTDEHPVTCVSWHDAQDYVGWLSEKTGFDYQLPSESQWEYAARAGTTTHYFWGRNSDEACTFANVADRAAADLDANLDVIECNDTYYKTAPVGKFQGNKFGLHDTAGNVWEWVMDRWHPNYVGAPADSSVWNQGNVSSRVLRGGSWHNSGDQLRSAHRLKFDQRGQSTDVGFRVARQL